MHELEWTSVAIEGNGWRDTHHDLQTGDARLELLPHCDEIVDMPVDFLLPAAREQCEHPRFLWKTERFTRFFPRRHVLRAIQQRMPDERCIDPVSAKELFLEWKNHRRLRNQLGQLRQSSSAPRPDLRCHVAQDRDAGSPCGRRDFHIEAWVVDQYDERDLAPLEHAADRPQQLEVPRDVFQHFEKSHDAQLMVAVNQLHALLGEPCPANGKQLEVRSDASELARHTRRMEVAGCFPGDKQNLTHCAARGRRVKEESSRSPSRFGARHRVQADLLHPSPRSDSDRSAPRRSSRARASTVRRRERAASRDLQTRRYRPAPTSAWSGRNRVSGDSTPRFRPRGRATCTRAPERFGSSFSSLVKCGST